MSLYDVERLEKLLGDIETQDKQKCILGSDVHYKYEAKHLSSELRRLSQHLMNKNPDSQVHGFLGGRDGYGQEFSNEFLSVSPFEYDLDCDCGADDIKIEKNEAAIHKIDCRSIKPNFHYFKSNLKIEWYKYIGRSMWCNQNINEQNFKLIIDECINSM